MKDQITERLKSLQAEYEAGQKMLAELDARRASLTTTLLRIEGAIQVLKEMAGEPAGAGPNGADPETRPT
jgi:predicted nuclease with TOPRIM domain